MPVRQWFVNETGDPAADKVAVEYNGLLDAGAETAAFRWLLAELPRADELVMRNAAEEAACRLEEAAFGAGWGVRPIRCTASPWIDLATLANSGEAFEAGLGRNTRAAVRRAIRLYEGAQGPLAIRRAETVAKALDWFGRLEALHRAQWASRGREGAFADPRCRQFHRHYIEQTYEDDRADLLRISAGEEEVGYLYNLRGYGGSVHAYQSGFVLPPDNRWKPGYVSHALAIRYYIAQRCERYDFLAGEAPYKLQMARERTPLRTLAVFAPRLKFMVESMLRRAARACRG